MIKKSERHDLDLRERREASERGCKYG